MKMFLHCHTCTAEPLSLSHQKPESRGCRRGTREAKHCLAALKLSPPVPRSCKSQSTPPRAAAQHRSCSVPAMCACHGPVPLLVTVLLPFSSLCCATVAAPRFWRLFQGAEKRQFKAAEILEGLRRAFVLKPGDRG